MNESECFLRRGEMFTSITVPSKMSFELELPILTITGLYSSSESGFTISFYNDRDLVSYHSYLAPHVKKDHKELWGYITVLGVKIPIYKIKKEQFKIKRFTPVVCNRIVVDNLLDVPLDLTILFSCKPIQSNSTVESNVGYGGL